MARLFILAQRFNDAADWHNATPEMHQLHDHAKARGIETVIDGFAAISCVATTTQPARVWIGDRELQPGDGLVFRGTADWHNIAGVCTRIAHSRGIYCLDPIERFQGGSASKTLSTIQRAAADIGSDSIILTRRPTAPPIDHIDAWIRAAGLDYPVIVKPSSGRQGSGVTLASSPVEIQRAIGDLADDDYIVQRYEPFTAEYRVIVLHGQILGATVKHRPPDQHTANAATGSNFTAAPDTERQALDTTLLKAAPARGLVGIDIGTTPDGPPRVIEVNHAPQWTTFAQATGIDIAEHIIHDFATHNANATTPSS